jgi:hypothetical protein
MLKRNKVGELGGSVGAEKKQSSLFLFTSEKYQRTLLREPESVSA